MNGIIHRLNEIRTLCEMYKALSDVRHPDGEECKKLIIEINERLKQLVEDLEKRCYEAE